MTTRPTRSAIALLALMAMTSILGCSRSDNAQAQGKPASAADTEVETADEITSGSARGVNNDGGGVDVLEVVDAEIGRSFDVSLWPAASDQSQSSPSLVVISHGFAGDRTSHEYLALALADAGYTVAASTHPDLAGLDSGRLMLDPLQLRPRHLSLVIDAAETAMAVERFDQVAVIGHSMGGYTALRAAGAELDVDGLATHCEANPSDITLCRPGSSQRFTALATAGSIAADPRIDRLVLLAPAYGPVLSPDSLATIGVPVLLIKADDDAELPGQQVSDLGATIGLSIETRAVEGSHFVFVRSCTEDERSTVPEICDDPAGVDRADVHRELTTAIDQFLAEGGD